MWDRNKVLEAFREAIFLLRTERPERVLKPRTVALRAHAIYCAGLGPEDKRPAVETFRKFATGQLPCQHLTELLSEARVRRAPPTRLDRERLRSVFEEAIERLESRLLKGRAKPRQILRRAYDLYTKGVEEGAPLPTQRTFEWLVYGKTADPEISTLIQQAIKKKETL